MNTSNLPREELLTRIGELESLLYQASLKLAYIADTGDVEGSGYTVALWIEREAFKGTLPPIQWRIHSANPVGQERIRRCMEQAERFWCRSFG